jgi:very-short-patch-repair endonuclease
MRSIDIIASRLARRQEGVFSRTQLLRRGVKEGAIERRLAAGHWVVLAPGVYGFPSHAGTWLRQVWIAILAHPGSAAGLETAAALRSFEGYGDAPIELVAPKSASARSSVANIHRYDGARISLVRGLPATTAAQTIADLCGGRSVARVEPALDRLILAGRVTLAELEERVRFYEGSRRRGLPLFAALVAERGEGAWRPSESQLEDLLRKLVRRLNGVEVAWQPSLPWRPTTGERLDAMLTSHGTILEADGRTWHARLRDFDADRWRDNEAAAHGLVVLRFSFVHLTHRFTDCVDLTHEVLRRRRRPAA